MTPACKTCAFWEKGKSRSGGKAIGMCHKRPPADGTWPSLLEDEWCGEWLSISMFEDRFKPKIVFNRTRYDART